MDWSRLVGWQDPWSPGSLGLSDAWVQCPDARWMFAAATYGGVDPRQLAGALCACVREVAAGAADEWEPVLSTAERYARGDLEADDLSRALPSGEEQDTWRLTPVLLRRIASGLRSSEAAETMAIGLASHNLVRALDPRAAEADRAEGGANALGFLSAIAALAARRSSRETASSMLEEVATGSPSFGALVGRGSVDRESSPSWDDAAERAFSHALSRCADLLRDSISSPFSV